MKTYTKIDTHLKRYQNIPKDCPNPKWAKFNHKVIPNAYANPIFEYLRNNKFEAYSKIDGTNSKICFYPSTQEIYVGGKDDNSQSLQGQFEFLQIIADRILPIMKELYPKETARFIPKVGDDKKIIINEGNTIELEESPVYIYGEYFGNGVGKAGKQYSTTEHHFMVFDICQQGWWIPSDMRHDLCKRLNLNEVPYYGIVTLAEAEEIVRKGFKTKVENVANPDLIEEGLVLRPTCLIKDRRGERIIVKVKHRDFHQFDVVRKEFTDEEFEEFNKWYFDTIENGED